MFRKGHSTTRNNMNATMNTMNIPNRITYGGMGVNSDNRSMSNGGQGSKPKPQTAEQVSFKRRKMSL
jgi:hypothetical protein